MIRECSLSMAVGGVGGGEVGGLKISIGKKKRSPLNNTRERNRPPPPLSNDTVGKFIPAPSMFQKHAFMLLLCCHNSYKYM